MSLAAEEARPDRRHGPLLNNHRRAALYATLLFAAMLFMLIGVGRHPTDLAPLTTFRPIGNLDRSLYDAIVPHRGPVLTHVFDVFDLTGKGIFTIPLRTVLLLVLMFRRRWAASIAFALAWALSEVLVEVLKPWYGRGRPPFPLVHTVSYSFPSGHATAAAAITVAIVLAFMRPGHRRRVWFLVAIVFSFTMALSRVYLGAHWLSDVETGVLLGSGAAVGSFALVESIKQRRLVEPLDDQAPAGSAAPLEQGADAGS
jgi:membrane-associated phospholipid phosphatase